MVTRRLPSRLPTSTAPDTHTPPVRRISRLGSIAPIRKESGEEIPAPRRVLSRLPATSPLPEYEPVSTPTKAVRVVRRIQTPVDLFPDAAIPPTEAEAIAQERASQEAARDGTDYAAIMQGFKDRTGNSRRKAIRAMCVWCCVGNVAEVRRCEARQCPLHGFRMGKTPEAQAREDAGLPPLKSKKNIATEDDEEGEEE